jgi:hypothetical protein
MPGLLLPFGQPTMSHGLRWFGITRAMNLLSPFTLTYN